MDEEKKKKPLTPWRARLHEVIFEADTPAGRAFDVALLWCIILSVAAVMLESIDKIGGENGDYRTPLQTVEWSLTVLFTVEYIVRLVCVGRPVLYARSFYGIVDLLAILPTYLSLIIPGAHPLVVVRSLRLLRIFRLFKLAHFVSEGNVLLAALRASRGKIVVFLLTVLILVLIIGSVMYLIEGPEHGFTSIPKGIYWAIVTMTTVGYGDITPKTTLGQTLSAIVMILGYGIIAIPTGIVSVELAQAKKLEISTQACPSCSKEGHDVDAVHCKFCGTKL